MSFEKIIQILKKLTPAEQATVIQHLLDSEKREDSHSLHETAEAKFRETDQLADIESKVKILSGTQQQAFLDWVENLLEDRLELTEEFKAEIEAGKKDIAEGRVRIRKP